MREHIPRTVVGVDENGLGPRLGPMIVTAAMLDLRVDDADYASLAAAAGIGDSKKLCAHGAMGEVESLVLALLDLHLGETPISFRALLALVNLHDEAWMRAPCPDTDARVACFGAEIDLPAYGPGITPAARARAASLLASGVSLRALRSASVCARRLNLARAAGRSRFDLDLDAMIDLVIHLRSLSAHDLVAVCGKIGGRKSYEGALSRSFALVSTVECSARRSAYQVPSVGFIDFVRDADASHPAVSLASLFGKYLRELSMERIHRYYSLRLDGIGRASGYHDPMTARFVAATELFRRSRGIDPGCFER